MYCTATSFAVSFVDENNQKGNLGAPDQARLYCRQLSWCMSGVSITIQHFATSEE
jgi:hypothetical protein